MAQHLAKSTVAKQAADWHEKYFGTCDALSVSERGCLECRFARQVPLLIPEGGLVTSQPQAGMLPVCELFYRIFQK